MSGVAQVDPNTDTAMLESDDILKYLFETYADGRVPLHLAAGPLTSAACAIGSMTSKRQSAPPVDNTDANGTSMLHIYTHWLRVS